METGEIVEPVSELLPALPVEPGNWPTTKLADACQQVYERRDLIVGAMDAESAIEALRRTGAIERYVRGKEAKDAARRAARVLETAVGEALPSAEEAQKAGRGKKVIARDHLSHGDRMRFRLMARYRDSWWPKLQETPLSRRQVLDLIDRARNPDDGSYMVGREYCTTDDLDALADAVEAGKS